MNNSEMHAILAEYCRRGWRLFPCRARAETWTDRNTGEVRTAAAKTPLVQWREAATSDPAQIKLWMEQYPHCMWGCATGSASGFWALDLDRHEGGADGMAALREYVRKHGLAMQKTLAQRTAGGGWHLLFKMPEGADIRNAAGVLSGVDVRATGGYIVIAPSFNVDAGAGYEWQDRGIPIAPPPNWLLKLISQKSRPAPAQDAKAAQAGAQAPYSGADGGTPYGLQAMQDELATLRAAEQGTRNDTLNRAGVKLFALAAGGELDADTVAAELKAAASMIGLPSSEAAATIASARKAGYASPRKAPDAGGADYSGMTVNGQAPGRAQNGQRSAQAEDPLPLRRPPQPQAPYPVECFLEFGQAVLDVAAVTDTSPSMVGGTMLSVMSWLAQRLANIRTPKHVTPLSLYMLLIGATGDGKSTVENILAARLKAKEKVLMQQYQEDLKAYEVELKSFERELKKLEGKKNLSREAYKKELAELEETRPIAPAVPVFMIGDANIEGLFKQLRYGLPYIGVFSDEAGRLFGGTAFSAENRLKTIANLATVWSGGPLDKMRGGEGVSKLYDRRLCANLMIQPEVAAPLFADTVLSGQGYLCRQLISWPVSLPKSPDQTGAEALPSVQYFYEQCDKLLSLPVRTDENGGLIFDDLILNAEALEAYRDYFRHIEKNRMADCQYEPVDGYAKRAAEQALRIAGCIAMARDPASRVIPLEVMEAGITISNWYLDEILRITLDDMTSPEVLQAERLLNWLHERKIKTTAVKQVLQYGPNTLREKKAVEPVIDLLVSHGWLVPIPGGSPVIMGGGKESFAKSAWKVIYAVSDENKV